MTQLQYRTTKIPAFYFNQIEGYLARSTEFVSVSEFIRDSIKEKLFRIKNEAVEKRYFLIVKDIVFNEETINKVHEKVMEISQNKETSLLKEVSLQSIVDRSVDIDYVKFLGKFLVHFAYVHPFEDGNKRTSWTLVDVFLRLNNKKLDLKADKSRETKDEIFIWQNSTNQRTEKQVMQFLERRIVDYSENTNDLDKEISKSTKENKILLERLSR